MELQEKREGFPGQRIVVLPRSVIERAAEHVLTRGLLPTDVGWFPHAREHLRERPAGVEQAVFIYCTKGLGWCELGGRRVTLKPGDLLVVPPRVPHVYGADGARPWSIHWFHAGGPLLAAFMAEMGVTVEQPVLRLGEDDQVLALFEELLDCVEHGYTTLQLLYASQTLAHLLASIIRNHRGDAAGQPSPGQKIARTIQYMKQHLGRNLLLAALAGVANLSRSQYTALFKTQTGYAPIDYFTRLRMHRACQLLDTTDLTVKQVASELGYADPLHFSRLFRKVNEATPTGYRAMRKG